MEAADRAAALLQIDRQGLFPIVMDAGKAGAAKAERTASGATSGSGVASLLPAAVREVLHRKRRPKMQELATFTQQMANLLHSGMPLTVALNSMSHLQSKGVPSEVSKQLRQDVMEGKSLSDAMSKQSHIFTDLYVNMVRAGGAERRVGRRVAPVGGPLRAFRRGAVQVLFGAHLPGHRRVCVGVVIVIFFMTFMLPKFMEIFEGFKVPLPPATQFLISLSNGFRDYWWLMALVLVAVFIVFKRFQSTENGKLAIDRWKMNAPVLGKVVRLNLFAQFSRTLLTLLVNGVPVLNALKITEQILPNRIMRQAIAKTRDDVTDGKTIAQPLAHSQLFPQLMIDLVKIGEETRRRAGRAEERGRDLRERVEHRPAGDDEFDRAHPDYRHGGRRRFPVVQRAVGHVHHHLEHRPMKSRRAPSRSGFTMIELMIVIGIMAMIMAMGIPSVFSALKKDPIRQSVSDLLDACKEAPDQGDCLWLSERDCLSSRWITPSPSGPPPPSGRTRRGSPPGRVVSRRTLRLRRPLPAPGSHRFSDQIVLEMLSVNFQELKDEEFARVRFFPNGTCDEFTAVLHWPEKHAYRKITLDIISGVADVEVIR